LTVVVAQRTRQAAQADVDRRQVFSNAVHVLVDKQLKPGVDASRADAELAAARNQLIRAEQAEEYSRIGLAQTLGIAGTNVQIVPGNLAASLPATSVPTSVVSGHPSAQVATSAIAEVRAREHVLDQSYFPRFTLQSAYSARGSGVLPNGANGSDGLEPSRRNWAVGVTATFPLLDIFSIRFRKQAEAANERTTAAQYDQVVQNLTAQLQRAQSALDAAQRVAANTVIELQAAQLTNQQAEARYRAGLTTVVEVADAQRILVQAESDDAVARVSVWRALLSVSFAQGNLQPFLDIVQK
jgi:outer membrane protein TolC